jgi:hypothetical protein
MLMIDSQAPELGTVPTGTTIFLNLSIPCFSLHFQRLHLVLNKGEHLEMAAMTTGYVFRIDNPAIDIYAQRRRRRRRSTTYVAHLSRLSDW